MSAPPQTLTGRAFTIGATVSELYGDAGASATLTASANGVVLATVRVAVPAGGQLSASLPVTLPAPGQSRIDLSIAGADPYETALGNNSRSATIDATDFQVVPSNAVGPSLAGYGGQFNENVYAAISRSAGVSDDNLRWMEQSVLALRPQFSRIFFAQAAFNDPDMMASFVRTVLFAQRTGTTINVTWQGGTLDVKSGSVQKFAEVLVNLVVKLHVTNLRWVTLQNEPNSTKMTLPQYENEYRELDPYLANIRGQVRFMGGDLVQTNQRAWFTYLGAHMTDILDAYSIHVFWDYWDVQKLQDRLTEVRAIVDGLPEAQRKPLYVTEYGVRGLRTYNGAAAGDPGVWMDGTPITETNVSAFEHAWLDILSSRLGYVGTSKWDTFFGRYDKGVQAYYMIGSPDRGWPKHPMYNLFYLLTATVKPGWHAVEVDQVPGTTRLVTAYTGGWDWTLVGLDTAGAQLNGASTVQVPYTIGGLPPSQTFRLVVWNDVGDGLDGPAKAVTTDAAGTATFTVPQQGVFTLTTRTGTVGPRNTLPLPD
ncbi:MAG: hypothetical protein ACXVRZ_06270 [Gaiellaceae bacterium]